MSDILCRWLNQDLRLSKAVESDTFASDFSSGYLIGEVLHKYQLQKDFSMFMKKDTSISKVNNFTRIEPTLKLLGMSFDINTAQDLMQEKQGAATHLLHQLYVLLEKNKKAEIGGTMMEIMQPAANFNVTSFPKSCIFKHLSFYMSVVTHPIHPKKRLKIPDEKQMKDGEKHRWDPNEWCYNLLTYSRELHVRLDDGHIAFVSLLFMQTVQTEIAQFETNRKKLVTSGFDFLLGSGSQACEVPGSETKMTLQSNSKYIQEIRQRLEENAVACEQRKKRVDRFLVEQFKAHEAQEEAQREEQLVRRLTRQTRQEQRLATQLLQMRMQKEVIRENRLFREQQYQQRRERDFREALDREAVLAQQAKLDCAEEIGKELEFCNRIAAERAQNRYKKHFQICKDILEQITDLATKVGEYRLLTGNLIPGKLMREWKELLFRGLPLFEPVKGHRPEFSTPLDPVELKKQDTLNDQDYDEYTHMVGEWTWPEEAGETQLPPGNNDVLGHVVHRLRNIVHPPVMEPSPVFPHFSIKACVLGKICSGKTTCVTKIAEAHGICVLSADSLIEEAVNAYKNGEEKDNEQLLTSSTSLKSGGLPDLLIFLCYYILYIYIIYITLSTRAIHGAAAENELRKGKAIPDELLVGIIVEAISQIPAQSGWILDGFPVDITQAHLLEKALGGSVGIEKEVLNSRTNLAADPNPPKPPPPPAPVLDLAVLLDVPDACAVKLTNQMLTLCYCGFARKPGADTDTAAATTSQSTDKNLYLAQIPHRIAGFQENWPELEKWYGGKQNILVHVDADVDDDELYSRVESILQLLSESCFSFYQTLMTIMQQLRSQRTEINHHMYNIREGYKHYLGRPDLKQELVSQWQKDFNGVPDNMRKDEETTAELHMRLDGLRERLWDISDKRKEEDEQERDALLYDSWLEDHTAVLINHHSALMQVTLQFLSNQLTEGISYLPEGLCKCKENETRKTVSKKTERHVFCRVLRKLELYHLACTVYSLYIPVGVSCHYPSHPLCCSGPPSPPPAPTPAPPDDKNTEKTEKTRDQKVREKIRNAAKVRLALVKGHGLVMVHSLQSRAEQTFSSMQKWLEAHYLAEMKRYGTVVPVVLVLIFDSSVKHYLLFVTITYYDVTCLKVRKHISLIARQNKNHSSATLFNCLHSLSSQIKDTLNSFLRHRHFLFCLQVMELVSLLMDEYKLIDWRRFVLSAALPWPFPSLTQLLAVLQRFRAADAGDTGYVHKEQYLQIELWFSNESVQTVPEDPSEPVPYDRLANLREFFFQLFADHSFSPPRLDYVSMLQYFAADPNPRQGFIRALSVVLGQHLKHSSLDHLSMPCMEEATELTSIELDGNYKEEETPEASGSLSEEQEVGLKNIRVLKMTFLGLIMISFQMGILFISAGLSNLVQVFRTLEYKPEDRVPFSILSQHPFIQGWLETSKHYQLVVSVYVDSSVFLFVPLL
uniref:Sperm flagellar 2 n=1 Tax=Amphiprion percula TaxID=161767 RepID=A0A3P8TMZ8_AMPPE